jgi:hypothetical protein
MNAVLTAENRPAWLPSRISAERKYWKQNAHEDEGGVQVFVVLPCIVSVELFGFSAVYGEEVGAGIVGPQRVEEFLEGGMEASES